LILEPALLCSNTSNDVLADILVPPRAAISPAPDCVIVEQVNG
jgi:hypothetical protein